MVTSMPDTGRAAGYGDVLATFPVAISVNISADGLLLNSNHLASHVFTMIPLVKKHRNPSFNH